MDLNIHAIFQDFQKEYSDLHNYEEALDYVKDSMNLSQTEAAEIGFMAKALVEDKFYEKTLTKMKKKNPELYAAMVAMNVTSVFFGIYLSKYLK
jgi:K+/H+ antiporter YhaU regulatory subunit KhtT